MPETGDSSSTTGKARAGESLKLFSVVLLTTLTDRSVPLSVSLLE
jgi:hypothetical protein